MMFSILNMDFSDRVKTRMQAVGINAAELATKVGVSKGAVTHWTNGTNQAGGKRLMRLAEVLECDAGWLISGSSKTYKSPTGRTYGIAEDSDGDIAGISNVGPALQPYREPKTYPLISWIAAGDRAESPDLYAPGDGEELIESTENAGPSGYWLDVKGNSMTSDGSPSFLPGMKILVRPEGYDIINGKFYVAKHRDGETTFKQYMRDAGTEYLVPLNPSYKTVEMDGEWRIIGRVVDAKITGL